MVGAGFSEERDTGRLNDRKKWEARLALSETVRLP